MKDAHTGHRSFIDIRQIVVLAVGSSALVIIVLLTVWLINYITNKLIGA